MMTENFWILAGCLATLWAVAGFVWVLALAVAKDLLPWCRSIWRSRRDRMSPTWARTYPNWTDEEGSS